MVNQDRCEGIEHGSEDVEDIECGSEDIDDDDEEEDALENLISERKRLNKELDSRILKYEADDIRQIAKKLENTLGGVAELRLSIYEFLCSEDDVVHIPNLNHGFFHEHDAEDTVSWVVSGEDWPSKRDKYEKGEIVKERLLALRERYIFDSKLLGAEMAADITRTFLKTNVLHFRDARLMEDFLNDNTPFPSGPIPRDHVRNIVIYIRFEDFLEEAGWDVRYYSGEMPEQPGPDFEWKEHGVYSKFRRDIAFMRRLSFARPPKVTLVMVTPFRRWDAEDLDEDRIELNFLEVVLPTYQHLKKNGSETKVVSKDLDSLKYADHWYCGENEDVTWQFEIAAEVYAESPRYNYAYPGNGSKTPQRV